MIYTAAKNKGILGIIVERGGNGSHLIITANEKNLNGLGSISICLLPNALSILKEGTEVVLSSIDNQLTLLN